MESKEKLKIDAELEKAPIQLVQSAGNQAAEVNQVFSAFAPDW